MAFNVRPLNHTPQWYHDNCLAENGGSPAFRAMLTADMKFVGADIDSEMTYMERVHTYEESWDEVLSGKNKNADPTDLLGVMDREGLAGERPVKQYAKPPFSTITRLMEKEGLSTTDLGKFIRWKAKADNVKAARKAKLLKKSKQAKSKVKVPAFLRGKMKQLLGEL